LVVRTHTVAVSSGLAAHAAWRNAACQTFRNHRNQLSRRIRAGTAVPYGPPRPPPPAPPAPPAPPVPFWRGVYLGFVARLWGAFFAVRGAFFAVRGALLFVVRPVRAGLLRLFASGRSFLGAFFGALSLSGFVAVARPLAGDFLKFVLFYYTLRMLERFIPWSFDFDEVVQFVLVFLGLRPPSFVGAGCFVFSGAALPLVL
jgi:hypothetical protein